jgi:hypothetical protein
MLQVIISVLLLAISSNIVLAGNEIPCADTKIVFSFVPNIPTNMSSGIETVLTVEKEGRNTVLKYRNIDYIGGICAINAKSKRQYFVYQAYCGGSGCMDLDNWGIIDLAELHVLLVPNNWNRKDAVRILGEPLPVIEKMISINKEGEKIGIKAH